MNATSDRLARVFSQVFGKTVGEIDAQTSRANLAMWDSLHHLKLVMAIESEFGVEFEPEEIETLNSFADALRRLSERAPNQ